MARYGITTPARRAAFLAQIGHESAGLTRLVESLDYAAERLVPVFGAHRITATQAAALGRKPGRPAQQQAIANQVYGGAWGLQQLGNVELNDGWRYRGRGALQITGRANYTRCAAALGVPLETLPACLETPTGAAEAAAWWWANHGCNALADTGDFSALTRRINGGLTGLAERVALLNQARVTLAA
ncbi:endolysin [Pseudoroseomonas rhizosphaerae]|uniref:Endolysin n=2 Tax=Teichococcus rhizosphaerae TaxID=1335062 RepID=A0A2C6Z3W4_9PROT|nr:endolysin [Pseudoroseomonas rhizosphaerae]